jgi:hypothetical protein
LGKRRKIKNKKLSYFTKLHYHAPIERVVEGLGGKKESKKYKIELSHPLEILGFHFFTELHYHAPGGYQADEKARFGKAAGVGQVLHKVLV